MTTFTNDTPGLAPFTAEEMAALDQVGVKIISRKPILRHADTNPGTMVIVEVRTYEWQGKRYEADVWAYWGNPSKCIHSYERVVGDAESVKPVTQG